MRNNSKVIVVMPAFNAVQTIKDTYNEIPLKYRKNIILVDDQSTDNTIEAARALGIRVCAHKQNLGYGGNQKSCYREALQENPDIIVMLHPDYQYDATLIDELIRPISQGRYDFMFGSRLQNRTSALKGGMPQYKYYINRFTCLLENILLGVNFTEHFSGFRIYSAEFLRSIPFQHFSNDFVFDQQMTISAISKGFRIGEIAIPTRYHKEASSIKWFKGGKFLIETFWMIFLYKLHQLRIIKSKIF